MSFAFCARKVIEEIIGGGDGTILARMVILSHRVLLCGRVFGGFGCRSVGCSEDSV